MKLNRNFCLLSFGALISLLGSSIQSTSIYLYILDSTGSGKMITYFILAGMLPSLIIVPLAGVIGDRMNRKAVMIIMDFIRGFITLFLSLVFLLTNSNIEFLFIATAFIGIMDSIFNASNKAIITELVKKSDYLKGNSILSGIDRSTSIIGPILGGILYSLIGIKKIFLVNSISFFISGIFELLMNYKSQLTDNNFTIKIFLKESKTGLSYIKNNKSLIYAVSFAMIINLFYMPTIILFVPIILKKYLQFSSFQYGITQSILPFGILSGNMLLITLAKSISMKNKIKKGLISRASCTLIFSIITLPLFIGIINHLSSKILILSVILFSIGASSSFIDTPFTTILQNLIPNEMRSRIFSLVDLLFRISVPAGIALLSCLLGCLPIYIILICVNLLSLTVTVIFLVSAPNEIYIV